MRVSSLSLLLASIHAATTAADIYNGPCKGNNTVKLRIGNGGAGQSGLIKELADTFIKSQTPDCKTNPFAIEWVKGDTTETINNLKSNKVDIGITYHRTAAQIAIDTGIVQGCTYTSNETNAKPCFGNCTSSQSTATKPCFTFRDHFYLVGPKDNAPQIVEKDDITETFSKLYGAAEAGKARFLSRYDKSATNIKDSELWVGIGQVPWASPPSKWYHQYTDYPLQALKAAIQLGEYTVTDRGTFLTLRNQEKGITESLSIYKSGENVPELLNPADIIVATKPKDQKIADAFVKWVLSADGQAVIAGFHKGDGFCLYRGFAGGEGKGCYWDLEKKERERALRFRA